jgi:hypothetical protein
MSVPDDSKIFSDREIAMILQKAAELQEERGGRVSGLSLEELRQVASEAGIEPHLVEDAVKELRRQAQPADPPRRKSRKGQTRWEQSVELPVRLDNEDIRALLAHLEAEFGGHGSGIPVPTSRSGCSKSVQATWSSSPVTIAERSIASWPRCRAA